MSIPEPYQDVQLPLPDPEAYPGEPREYARALMQRKDDIEKEIDTLNDVLASHNANANTPLVDPEGYPRGDIDVYSIRHARAALARLRNDRNEVVRRLASALEGAFSSGGGGSLESTATSASEPLPNGTSNGSSANGRSNGASTSSAANGFDLPDTWPERPLAKVNTVAAGSPASDAGLQAGDLIYTFAGIQAPTAMSAIGPVVQRSEGTPLTLLIQRGTERKALRLTPRPWAGRGLLGCHILPP